jgi:hypothetical protein
VYYCCGCGDDDDEDSTSERKPRAAGESDLRPPAPPLLELERGGDVLIPWELVVAPMGDRLAVVKDGSVTVRDIADGVTVDEREFAIGHGTLPRAHTVGGALDTAAASAGSDPRVSSSRRPAAWSLDSALLAICAHGGGVHVCTAEGRLRHFLSPQATRSPVVDIAWRAASVDGTRCSELVYLTADGVIGRLRFLESGRVAAVGSQDDAEGFDEPARASAMRQRKGKDTDAFTTPVRGQQQQQQRASHAPHSVLNTHSSSAAPPIWLGIACTDKSSMLLVVSAKSHESKGIPHVVSAWRLHDDTSTMEYLGRTALEALRTSTSSTLIKASLSAIYAAFTPRPKKRPASPDEHDPSWARLCVSPCESSLAVLDNRGWLTVWDVRPQPEPPRAAPLIESLAPSMGDVVPLSVRTGEAAAPVSEGGTGPVDTHKELNATGNIMVDVAWWSSTVLARAYSSGHVVLTSVPSNGPPSANLLGEKPEKFHGAPQLAGYSKMPPGSEGELDEEMRALSRGVLVLECERLFLRKKKVRWRPVPCMSRDVLDSRNRRRRLRVQNWTEIDEEGDGDQRTFQQRVYRLLALNPSSPQVRASTRSARHRALTINAFRRCSRAGSSRSSTPAPSSWQPPTDSIRIRCFKSSGSARP